MEDDLIFWDGRQWDTRDWSGGPGRNALPFLRLKDGVWILRGLTTYAPPSSGWVIISTFTQSETAQALDALRAEAMKVRLTYG